MRMAALRLGRSARAMVSRGVLVVGEATGATHKVTVSADRGVYAAQATTASLCLPPWSTGSASRTSAHANMAVTARAWSALATVSNTAWRAPLGTVSGLQALAGNVC